MHACYIVHSEVIRLLLTHNAIDVIYLIERDFNIYIIIIIN
jgi:hypothetical protein